MEILYLLSCSSPAKCLADRMAAPSALPLACNGISCSDGLDSYFLWVLFVMVFDNWKGFWETYKAF